MNTKLAYLGLLTASVFFVSATQANASAYKFTDLGTLGGTYSSANAINNLGQVVGSSDNATSNHYTDINYFVHATLWNGTKAMDLGTLRGKDSVAYAINDFGQIAGVDDTRRHIAVYRAVMWNGAKVTDLGTVGGTSDPDAFAFGINNAGKVVGASYTVGNIASHASLWNGSKATDLGALGENNGLLINSEARAINNVGQVVGNSHVTRSYADQDVVHATLWNGAKTTDLGTLGGSKSYATGINNAGQVVGYSSITEGDRYTYHAAIWNGATATDLGTLGGKSSYAQSINNAGQVVGYSDILSIGKAVPHATLWNDTTAIDLNSLLDHCNVNAGWELTKANGINDQGWIVGDAYNSNLGVTHAFLLTPVPEPETYAMLLTGLGLMGCVGRRRKTT